MTTAVEIVAIPNPYMLDWQGWADFVTGYNPGLVDTVDPSEPWQEFARRLHEAVPDAPAPEQFADWRDWAAALKLVLHL